MSDPKWTWKVELHPNERAKKMIASLPAFEIARSTADGTSDLDTEEEVRAGLPGHFGEEFVQILWVAPFGEEPEDDWDDEEE